MGIFKFYTLFSHLFANCRYIIVVTCDDRLHVSSSKFKEMGENGFFEGSIVVDFEYSFSTDIFHIYLS